jgi:hypothetical protein
MKTLTKNKWYSIVVFYIIAISSSFLFRLELIQIPLNSSIYSTFITGWLGAMGPFLGGLLMMYVIKPSDRRMTFTGLFRWKSIALIMIPAICLGFFGANNKDSLNPHLFGFLLGLYIAIYGILEETGWRGYLQDELREFKPIFKYFIVACFWYTWHLTFLGKTTILNEFAIFFILWASSVGIGIMADRTQSIIYASCFHIIGNIFSFSSEITSHITLNTRVITIIISLTIWLLAFRKLKLNLSQNKKNLYTWEGNEKVPFPKNY